MKEISSAYDDLEKRMAVFLGLGALMFTSLYLLTRGADLFTHLVRGSLAMVLASLSGWAYGHYLRGLVERNTAAEELPDNVERRSKDVQTLSSQALSAESRVVSHSEIPDTVIPAEESGRAVDFTLPELEPAKAGEEDLPPPPVPPGA